MDNNIKLILDFTDRWGNLSRYKSKNEKFEKLLLSEFYELTEATNQANVKRLAKKQNGVQWTNPGKEALSIIISYLRVS